MAAPGGKFFIHDKLSTPAVHHNSFKDLWESKWKKPVSSDEVDILRTGILNVDF